MDTEKIPQYRVINDTMIYKQLFVEIPSVEDVLAMCSAFGLKGGLTDETSFNIKQMRQLKTTEWFEENIWLLSAYYLRCKAKLYLKAPFTEKACITILRQVVKAHGFHLVSRDYTDNETKKKAKSYHLESSDRHTILYQDVILSFR